MVRRPSGTLALCLLTMWMLVGERGFTQVPPSGDPTSGSPAVLHGPSFVSDAKFEGSSLAGWQTLGQAEWSAENGELVGKATKGAAG